MANYDCQVVFNLCISSGIAVKCKILGNDFGEGVLAEISLIKPEIILRGEYLQGSLVKSILKHTAKIKSGYNWKFMKLNLQKLHPGINIFLMVNFDPDTLPFS